MRKEYIIKDARKILAEQINNSGTPERNVMDENPITMSKGLSAVIPKDNDGYCTVYKMDCADGLGLMTVYQVYPGIQLIYNDFEATGCYWDGNIDKIYWKSTIAERGVRAAACPAVPVFIWARVTYPSTQWITVHRKCLSHSSITVEFPLC